MRVSSIVTILVIVIVLVAGGVWLSRRNRTNDNAPAMDNSTTFNQSGLFSSSSDSSDGGVVLQQITLPQSGFAVIQTNANGRPGQVLGYTSLLSAGLNSQVKVGTALPLSEQTTYFISLYADTNNNGQFDEGTDQLMTNSSGQQLQQTFVAPVKPDTSSSTPNSGY